MTDNPPQQPPADHPQQLPPIIVNPPAVTVNPTPVVVNPPPGQPVNVTVTANPTAQSGSASSSSSDANAAAAAAAANAQPTAPSNAPPAFGAGVFLAPPDQAKINDIVHLEVIGSGILNAELLPGSGYIPKYGIFTVSMDHTHAVLDWDTRKWPNGPVRLRISAFNKPGGDPDASEIVAMQPRTWVINNPVEAPQTSPGQAASAGAASQAK
jgi:hypothetical protein